MKFYSIVFYLAIGIAAMLFNNTTQHRYYTERNNSTEFTPNDFLNYRRAYPNTELDQKSFEEMMNLAKDFNNTKRAPGPGTWNIAGPLNVNGRINTIAINPSNSNEIYVGAAFGGVFKTNNGGISWYPIFDSELNLPIGSLELDPNNSSSLWAGTGDNNISGTCYLGGGIYNSTDGGISWTNKGLANTYIISKIIVDPTNSSVIYASAMGSPFNADNNRGLYKSSDGGTTWSQVLFANDSTGVIDLVMDPNNSNILYACTFTRMRTTYRSTYHSNQCKIYKTINGGTTWTVLGGGLPTGDIGRIGIAISATNSNVLYAIVASTTSYIEGIYKSTDAGTTWIPKNSTDPETLGTCYGGYGWYFGKIHVNPTNDNIVYIYGVDKFVSYDGCTTWNLFAPDWSTYEVHADGHDLAFIDDQKIILATDGGLYKTNDNGTNWTDIDNMPTTQFYHVTSLPMSNQTFYGGAQDNGTIGGSQLNASNWIWEFGGDGFKFFASPLDTNLRYYETQWAGIYYNDNGSFGTLDAGLSGTERFNWDTPYFLDRFDPTIVYLGAENVQKMTGAPYGFFTPISGDLTNGPVIPLSGSNTITTLDQDYFDGNVLYAGTSDAHLWVTTNGGSTWNAIDGGMPNRYVTSINASPNNINHVYVSYSGYRTNDNSPHIYKSVNNGNSWTNIQGDLPNFAVNDIIVVPGDENHLIAATDAGVYHSVNAGVNWLPLGTGMPMVAVMELEFNESKTVLAAATFGRGIMTYDFSAITSTNNLVSNDLIIYPNPSSDYLFINSKDKIVRCELYNLKGEKVLEEKNITNQTGINVQQLAAATYIIKITITSNRYITSQFVKTK